MKKLYFATTNEGKLKEARDILGVEVVGTPLEIDEVQSLNPEEVATKKAAAYFFKLKKPLFVEDVSLVFECLGKLPGTFITYFEKELGYDGLTKIIKIGDSRKAYALTVLVYIDKNGKSYVFQGRVDGSIATKPRGKGFGWDCIFIPNGETRTFGEIKMEEKNKYSMRAKALKKMKKWLIANGKLD